MSAPPSSPVNCSIPCGQSSFSIIRLLNQPLDSTLIYPRHYLGASHEVFALTLVITWVLTLIWHPEQIFEHPGREIIGSFNPCYGWDYPPAAYVGLTFCSVNVYFTWRYAWLESTRTELVALKYGRQRLDLVTKGTAYFLAAASNIWLLLWIVGPYDGNWFA